MIVATGSDSLVEVDDAAANYMRYLRKPYGEKDLEQALTGLLPGPGEGRR